MTTARAASHAGPSQETVLGKALDRELLRRILSYVWPYKWQMAAALVVLPLAAAFELAQPYLLKRAIDEHIAVKRLEGLDRLALAYLGMLIGQYTLLFLQTYLMQWVGQKAMADLRDQLYLHVLRLSQAFFETTPVGRLMTRLTSDVESLTEMFASGLVALVGDLVKLAFILVTIFLIDVKLALFSLGSAPVLFTVAWLFRRVVREAFRDIRNRLSRLNTFLQENLSGVRIVQAFAQERLAAARFDQLNREYRKASARAIGADAALYAIVEAVGSFAIAGLLWHGGARIIGGTLTFGVLVAFIEYLQKFFAPIRDLSTKYTVLQQAMASAERIFELLDTHSYDAPAMAPGAIVSPPASQSSQPLIEFRHVAFHYRPEQPVLKDINLVVKRGETVAIVGPSGGGKTTLIKLLSRFYDPTSGTVCLDGKPLTNLNVDVLRRRVVLIGQEPYLFSGTLREAIGLGETSDEAIVRALRQAGAAPLLERLSLESPVQPRAINFSAGERQLFALARALCRDPELLVLDEATANVDPETERLIELGTAALMKGRTSIVIAHRLSTVVNADRIVVIEQGRIVEQGTRDELLAEGGLFARLYRLQTVGSGTSDVSLKTALFT